MSLFSIIPIVFYSNKKLGHIEKLDVGIKFHSISKIVNNGISSYYRIHREFKDEGELVSFLEGTSIGFGLPIGQTNLEFIGLAECYFNNFPNGFTIDEKLKK